MAKRGITENVESEGHKMVIMVIGELGILNWLQYIPGIVPETSIQKSALLRIYVQNPQASRH